MARVLLVEDDPDGRDIRAMLLERAGHQVAIAANEIDARAIFRGSVPDCVILDLRVPAPEDGLALIRDFRHAAPDVKLVVLAGQISDLDDRPERLLVDEVLAKPVRSERLINAVTSAKTQGALHSGS